MHTESNSIPKTVLSMRIHLVSSPCSARNLLMILVLCCGLAACDSGTGGSDAAQDELSEEMSAAAMADSGNAADSQMTRGMLPSAARRMEFSLEGYLPMVYGLIKDDKGMVEMLDPYARKVLMREVATSEELEAVFAQRDERIIPDLESFLGQADAEFIDENWEGLDTELNSIGISMTSAEGIFTGLTQAPMLSEQVASIASEPFRLYQDFLNANAYTQSGEYPFNNMEPYGELVRIGEQLKKKYPENAYTQKIESRFYDALEYMTDIHLVHPGSGMKQQGPASVFVGGTHTESYPWITEMGSREQFAKEHAESRYSDVMQRILENPSEVGTESETLYLIVTEWAKTKENARTKVFDNLSDGKDTPHYLQIRRGDGTDQYAITYRFYEDEEKANKAFEAVQQRMPNAQLIFCSVKGDKLYQLGI